MYSVEYIPYHLFIVRVSKCAVMCTKQESTTISHGSHVADNISREENELAGCLIHFALAWLDCEMMFGGNLGLSRFIRLHIILTPLLVPHVVEVM